MKNIAVIGAGTMGNGIAHCMAQFKFRVHLVDTSQKALDNGLARIDKNLNRMITKGSMTTQDAQETLACIHPFTCVREAVQDAELVIEAATENETVKMAIFKELDQHTATSAILATNTSAISITQIAAATERPEQVIGMHFMNPVPLMPLVEIIQGHKTSDAVLQTIVDLTKKVGKTPVIAQDYPGFVANRILMPMINEAIETLHQGVAGVLEIDTVMKLGMSHPMGPLQLADFIGLDVCLAILEVLYNGFKLPKYAPCPLLVNLVRSGNIGIKSGQGFYDYSKHKKATIVAYNRSRRNTAASWQ